MINGAVAATSRRQRRQKPPVWGNGGVSGIPGAVTSLPVLSRSDVTVLRGGWNTQAFAQNWMVRKESRWSFAPFFNLTCLPPKLCFSSDFFKNQFLLNLHNFQQLINLWSNENWKFIFQDKNRILTTLYNMHEIFCQGFYMFIVPDFAQLFCKKDLSWVGLPGLGWKISEDYGVDPG